MAYGLIINGPGGVGDEWFNSTTAFGFVEIASIPYAGTASSTPLTVSGGFTEAFAFYVPDRQNNYDYSADPTPGTTGNNRRPSISVNDLGAATPGVDKTLTVTVTIFGANTVGGDDTQEGGRVLVFAH